MPWDDWRVKKEYTLRCTYIYIYNRVIRVIQQKKAKVT